MALFRCSFLVALPAAFASAVVGGRGMTFVTFPTAFVRPSLNTRRCPTLIDLIVINLLSEIDYLKAYLQKLGVLDEFEVDAGLVAGAQAVSRHVQDGGGLSDGTAVHHGLVPGK